MNSLVGILPNQFHGILGDHGEDMPIENLKLTHDKKYLISSGHDDKLQFWDVAHLFQEEQEVEENEEPANVEEREIPMTTKEEGDSDNDSWGTDSDDDARQSKKNDKKRKKTQKKEAIKPSKKKNSAFFADM